MSRTVQVQYTIVFFGWIIGTCLLLIIAVYLHCHENVIVADLIHAVFPNMSRVFYYDAC